MIRKGSIVFALGLALGATVAMTRRAPSLDGARLASEVPVYPGASLEGAGTETTGDGGGAETRRHTWRFVVEDPPARIMEYYEEKLGTPVTSEAGGSRTLELHPAGAREGERVTITVEAGKLTIREELRVKRVAKR